MVALNSDMNCLLRFAQPPSTVCVTLFMMRTAVWRYRSMLPIQPDLRPVTRGGIILWDIYCVHSTSIHAEKNIDRPFCPFSCGVKSEPLISCVVLSRKVATTQKKGMIFLFLFVWKGKNNVLPASKTTIPICNTASRKEDIFCFRQWSITPVISA